MNETLRLLFSQSQRPNLQRLHLRQPTDHEAHVNSSPACFAIRDDRRESRQTHSRRRNSFAILRAETNIAALSHHFSGSMVAARIKQRSTESQRENYASVRILLRRMSTSVRTTRRPIGKAGMSKVWIEEARKADECISRTSRFRVANCIQLPATGSRSVQSSLLSSLTIIVVRSANKTLQQQFNTFRSTVSPQVVVSTFCSWSEQRR